MIGVSGGDGGGKDMKPFKIGIDSASLKPLGLSPFEVLDWAIINDIDGVQFSEPDPGPVQSLDRALLNELSAYAGENRLFLEWGGGEHVPLDPATGKPKDIFAINKKAAEQAHALGVATVRSSSRGLMRWNARSLPTEEILRLTAKGLNEQKKMLRDLGVILALETHFDFTTYELLRLFDICSVKPGECFGICLDTMNLLTMLEDPVAATERVLPWVVTTHVKDGALLITDDGFVTFPTEAGTGIVDLAAVFERLSTLKTPINLCLEDHGGDFPVPIFDPAFLARFPDLTAAELAALVKLSQKSQDLLDEGRIAVLDRDRWPEQCERRIKRGLRAVRRIVEEGRRGG
jgi:sugar phosphate isomerase/epimerase